MMENKNYDDSPKSIAVIGGGIAGLITSLKLLQNGYNVNLIEKQNFVGGYATSFRHDDYIVDLGPHVLTFPIKSEISDEILSMLGEENVIDLPSKSKLYKSYFQGIFFKPGTPISKILGNLGIKFCLHAFGSYLISKCKNLFKSKPDTIDEYMIALYGKFLYDFWFKNYIKLRISTDDYSLKNIENAYPKFSIKSLLSIILTKKIHIVPKGSTSKNPESTMFNKYPKFGMLFLIQKFQNTIIDKNGKFFLNSTITSINHNSPKKITFEQNNQKNELNVDAIVYCLSPKVTIQLFSNSKQIIPPKNIMDKAIMVFLFIDSPRIFDTWVINFNQSDLIFFRISQQNFLSKNICPKNKTILCVEIMCTSNDKIWKYDDSKLVSTVISDLKKIDILKNKVVDSKILKFNNFYTNSQTSSDSETQKTQNYVNSHKNEYFSTTLETNSSTDDIDKSTSHIHSTFLNTDQIIKKINLDFKKS